MFESIRRARDVKRSEVAEKKPDESDVDLGRRNFLRGAVATAAISAVPTFLHNEVAQAGVRESNDGMLQREARVDDMVSKLRRAVSAPDVRDALEGKGSGLIARVVRALQSPISPELVKGTKYDMTGMRARHCVQLTYQKTAHGPNTMRLVSAADPTAFKESSEAGYGNGVFLGTDGRFLTAQHVMEDAQKKPLSVPARDLVIVGVNGVKGRPEQVVQEDTSLTNEDIHGAYVSIEGIDPDATSDVNGYKSYPGVAMRLHRKFVERIMPGQPDAYYDRMAHSFMIALPPGEAQGGSAQHLPAVGMSGSPVFMLRNGSRVLAGILHGVTTLPDSETGRSVDVGFFHGIEEVREQLNVYMRSGA